MTRCRDPFRNTLMTGCVIAIILSLGNATVCGADALAAASPPSNSAIGIPLALPDCIDLKEVDSWRMSPDGNRAAIISSSRIWILDLNTGDASEVCPTEAASGCRHAFASEVKWVGNDQLLTMESIISIAESATYSASRARGEHGPAPTTNVQFVVRSVLDGNVILTRDATSANLGVVGVRDAGTWYVVDSRGDLRLYDAIQDRIGDDTLWQFSSISQWAYIGQVANAPEWFAAFRPYSVSDLIGRFEIVNISTGEKRSIDDVRCNMFPPAVTSDASLLFTQKLMKDGNLWPVAYELTTGTIIPMPQGERWVPVMMSAVRNSLIASIVRENPVGSGMFEARCLEIALGGLIRF